MRVLVLGRVFSGLKAGLAQGRWTPRGVPAFYKLVEGLASAADCSVLTMLAAKDDMRDFSSATTLNLPEAGRVTILGWRRPTAGVLRRLDMIVTEASQTIQAAWQAVRFAPDIVYATYAMLFPAALLSRFTRIPVVLRLMGIFPHQRAIGAPRFWLHRWALRSPFKVVVCSEDGSDPGALLPGLLNAKTELVLRLNGCDAPNTDRARAPGGGLKVLFVGRLEPYKGCKEFVDAAVDSLAKAGRPVEFVIVGDGPMREALQKRIDEAGVSKSIILAGTVAHDEVERYLKESDIYVSVNMNGNLSNANLEALAAGLCLVIPTSDPTVPLDTVTDRLLPDTVVTRYDREDPARALSVALVQLFEDPARVREFQRAARKRSQQLLKTWAECIEDDIALLRCLAAARVGQDNGHHMYANGRL